MKSKSYKILIFLISSLCFIISIPSNEIVAQKKPRKSKVTNVKKPKKIRNLGNLRNKKGAKKNTKKKPLQKVTRNLKGPVTKLNYFERGSTGRMTPRNSKEKKFLKKFKKKPTKNISLITNKLKDPRYRGWSKYKVNNTNIHFLRKLQNGKFRYADIKFKNRAKKKEMFAKHKGKLKTQSLSNIFNSKKNRSGRSPVSQFYQVRAKKYLQNQFNSKSK